MDSETSLSNPFEVRNSALFLFRGAGAHGNGQRDQGAGNIIQGVAEKRVDCGGVHKFPAGNKDVRNKEDKGPAHQQCFAAGKAYAAGQAHHNEKNAHIG